MVLPGDCGTGDGLNRTNPKRLPVSIEPVSLLAVSPAVGNAKLQPLSEALPEPRVALFDLVPVSATEMGKAVSFVIM